MKNIIYYFSATGNSLKVAKELASYLDNAELVHIHQENLDQCDPSLHTDADQIGFIFPTILSGIPMLVSDFIQSLTISHPSPYTYAIATHGDVNGAGIVFEQIAELLEEKNLPLLAAFTVRMPHNMPEKDHVITPAEREQLFKEASLKIPTIAKSIQMNEHLLYKGSMLKTFMGRIINKSLRASTKKKPFDRLFSVDSTCISCNRCSQVCPANNIKMVGGKPEWKLANCQSCFACAQWCPVSAIQYTKRTVGVERYHHPDVKVQELFYKED